MFLKRHSSKTEVFAEVVDALKVQFLSNTRIGLVNKRISGIALIENYEVRNYVESTFLGKTAFLKSHHRSWIVV
jgi:hypothetical protein